VQYVPGSLHSKQFGKYLPETRISKHMIHVGITVKDRAAADGFYRDILGFKQTWYGGMTDNRTDWVDMRVPEGTDWLEYMLNVHDPDPRVLGIMHHLALGTPDASASYKELLKRGLNPSSEAPKIGRDGKWQLNLYDPNLTRVELMEPKPTQKPCCSPIEQ
jgi:catechol 2,3-dioxygenase-like lactoylglutathione lyase family enzyme